MSCLGRIAMMEPLVDTVSAGSVCTTSAKIMSVDIATIKISELTFAAPFRLSFTRPDYAHALVAWFDMEFSHCHKPITFSTGPAAHYTHWKQTVFYLGDVLTGEAGETVSGVLKCRPNPKNRRDLDIEIDYEFAGKLMAVKRTQPFRLR